MNAPTPAEEAIRQTFYAILKDNHPAMIEVIGQLVKAGEPPTRIAAHVKARGGTPLVTGMVRGAAQYMKDHKELLP